MTTLTPVTPAEVLVLPYVQEAVARGFLSVTGNRAYYKLRRDKDYDWSSSPEEWVRFAVVAFLIVRKGYPPKRLDVEVSVPRRVPGDYADIVVFRDERGKSPYLVVETKADGQTAAARNQWIEQVNAYASTLRADLALYDDWSVSILFDTSGAYPSLERIQNRRGDRERVPDQYSDQAPKYAFIAGDPTSDIKATDTLKLESKVRRTHSIIWSGGKRDPLTSFDEWSKLLFAKVHDERNTPDGDRRGFQIGSGETATTVATRVHELFTQASELDKTIFSAGARIKLPDEKIYEIVTVLQDISIVRTDEDTIGRAFESFFGSVFRGELGQYFTARQIARFIVAAVQIKPQHFIIDPTAGSGGFLLEALLQVWRSIESNFAGQSEMDRKKYDFAMLRVFGIEIHEILARILKINLLIHHDGHTNVEGDRSCLDTEFARDRLKTNWKGGFERVIGNPPFGDIVKSGDRDLLGDNTLDAFEVAKGLTQVPSEHVILERGIDFLKDGGRLGFVVPDGLLNNQGEGSNCPRVRRFLATHGVIEAIVSLPDFAFRKSGAQNKTSILIFRKFTAAERARFLADYVAARDLDRSEDESILAGVTAVEYQVFLAEANYIGYTTIGVRSERNDLYVSSEESLLADVQAGSILGELRRFYDRPDAYNGYVQPDCTALSILDVWQAHSSHRLDPKYFLFKREERAVTPDGWVRLPISKVMRQRFEFVVPEELGDVSVDGEEAGTSKRSRRDRLQSRLDDLDGFEVEGGAVGSESVSSIRILKPDDEVTVLTIAQTGEVRAREAGKGRTPPEWRGMYFPDMPTQWYVAHVRDVVFSGIDLWKGCIAVVPAEFDGSLVSGEFPVWEIVDDRLVPEFLSTLLRSRYYRRAFRAITTGHSNRRRTQVEDFQELEISFPEDPAEQRRLIRAVLEARSQLRGSEDDLKKAMLEFSDLIDNRGNEEYPTEIAGENEPES